MMSGLFLPSFSIVFVVAADDFGCSFFTPNLMFMFFWQDVYEQQKELILLGERVVLTTLGFDLNVHHPYKPLVEAIKKFKVAQNALAQVAWNFVNDGYAETSPILYISGDF